ncbi:F-box protein SKIP19-like [Punica granatum]|uniref:F-box domain-containing protein n=2 Tax=Punica granatum TaxID=22663 RepID=A0A218WEN7_PUNGR|nr:F-box protein SKIP19-like [Punica granatum]OWM71285.1 hypothetical protein CDL15_Pgr011412 [Punica granatum]PKI59008.1 hypothetical protein CRG98_020576 [Punica granatum]
MSSSAEEPSGNWPELPRDLTAAILLRLGAIEILNTAQRVCTQWRSICKEPSMWRTIDMPNGGDLWDTGEDLDVMCRHAVDRSCGGLVDIRIENFCTDELLNYITASCTQIKRLRLVRCYYVSDEGLSEAAAKLPMLEDLELSYCSFSEEALEAVGCHCRRLKSLKLNSQGFRYPHIEVDEGAQAVAKTMPELRQLQLFGNKLTNVGLKAILDGCPHLEFLDLRQCFNINLSGKLGKQCAERIKDLRQPLDSTHDYEYGAELEEDLSIDEEYPSGISDIEVVSDYDYDNYFSGCEYDDSYSSCEDFDYD